MTESSTPRRRVSGTRRVRGDASAVTAAVLVLLALAAVLLTLPSEVPATATARSTGDVVRRTLLACPDVRPSRGVDSAVDLGLAPGGTADDLGDGGSVRLGPVGGAARPVDVPRGSVADVPTVGGPKIDATGDAAAGLFAFRSDGDRGRTLGVATCPAPRSQWWFTGAGAGLDHSSTLVLANVDPGPAVVDLRVLGPDGEVETVGTKGITIAPNTRQRIPLSEIAPQTDELAISVHANRGRVSASVTDAFAGSASVEPGQEWLSGTDRPSRGVRLAGLPGRTSGETLFVANPGELEAVVQVRVAGGSGTFTPTGLDQISVAPGSVEQIDLGKALPKKEPVALRVQSRVPVTATVRSAVQGDVSYAAPVDPLTDPAAGRWVGGVAATVPATAGAVAAKVTATAYDREGKRVDTTTLSIDPTATATWSPKKGAAYLVVSPEAGAVYGAVTYAGAGIATVPLQGLPLRVTRPVVLPAMH